MDCLKNNTLNYQKPIKANKSNTVDQFPLCSIHILKIED